MHARLRSRACASAAALAALLGFAAWVCGCTKAAATTGVDGGDAGAIADDADAAGTFAESACGTCTQQACAPQLSTCADDPGCTHYVACLFACPVASDGTADPACAAACPTAGTSTTTADIESLSACSRVGPASTCAACGVDGGRAYAFLHEGCPTMTDPSDPCYALTLSTCCHTRTACLKNLACVALDNCTVNCLADDVLADAGPDSGLFPSCYEACFSMNPGGLADFVPFDFCYDAEVADSVACGSAPDACVSCLSANCAEELLDMNLTPGGFGLYSCLASCVVPEICQGSCEEQYPEAVKPLEAFIACQENTCVKVCRGQGGA